MAGEDNGTANRERTHVATLHIYALNQPKVLFEQRPVQFPTKKAQELLYFLLVHAGEVLERDLVAERLWPMCLPKKSHHSLATALWRLRESLPTPIDHECSYLSIRQNAIGFNKTASYWFDAETFEQQATCGLKGSLPLDQPRLQALESAVELYRSDFLAGCWADWCLAKREQLQLLLVRVLKRLQCHSRHNGAFEAAIAYGQRLLALDPLLEEVHRELMRCYAAAGQRPLALAQFQCCQDILQQELHTAPMPQTTHLYHQIQDGHYPSDDPAMIEGIVAADPTSLNALLDYFCRTLDSLEPTWQLLRATANAYRRQREYDRAQSQQG